MKIGLDETELNRLSSEVIGAAIEVHRHLGPGLLESVYEHCLCTELWARGVAYERQVPVPIVYKGNTVNVDGLRLDVLVGGGLVVEIKAIERVLPVHEAQLLSYLRLSGHHLGLLLNFNVPVMRDGVKRIVNGL